MSMTIDRMFIEEVSSKILMTDASDLPSLGQLVSKFEELLIKLQQTDHLCRIERATDWIDKIKNIILNVSPNPNEDLATIWEEFSTLKNDIFPSGNVDDDAQSEAQKPNSSIFVLPEWVGDSTFRDFISAQKNVLEKMEADILSLEKDDPARLSSLKRLIHTMKGEAGVLGLSEITDVCHAIEDFFDANLLKAVCVDRLLQVKDWIAQAIESYSNLRTPNPSSKNIINILKDNENLKINNKLSNDDVNINSSPSDMNQKIPEDKKTDLWDEEKIKTFQEFIQDAEDGLNQSDQTLLEIENEGSTKDKINVLFCIFHSMKGVSLFLELNELSVLAHDLETYLNLARQETIELIGPNLDIIFDATQIMREMITALYNAVKTNKEIEPNSNLPGFLDRLRTAINGQKLIEPDLPPADPGERIGEILIKNPINIPSDKIEDALSNQSISGRRLGEELISDGSARPKQVAHALRAQRQASEKALNGAQGGKTSSTASIKETVNVNLELVDNVMELIGELVIVQSMIVNSSDILSISSLNLKKNLNQFTKICRDLQGIGMRMRMVPVRSVFQKMARMVRDLARKSRKEIRLIQHGESTEMDRSMVEQISDPLVHMIRNAVDHGIESIEERKKVGKPVIGAVRLSAYHEGGNIIIEIADDGRGLNKDAILRKALESNLIKEGENLTDSDIYNLIFAPGFSTAEKVTEISGRGVGMDVVRRNIEAMRGRVQISSTLGVGTTFKLVLPLTLAIIDGMLISCGKEEYIIPTLSIVESIRPDRTMLFTYSGRHELINIRGEILPLYRLDHLFNIPDGKTDPTQSEIVVVESHGKKIGVMVDDVITQQQVVIKSMGTALKGIDYISGAAILSDGRVGLIINVEELGQLNMNDMQTSVNA